MKTTITKTDGKFSTEQAVQWLNSQLAIKANGVYELTLQKQTCRSFDEFRKTILDYLQPKTTKGELF